MSYRITASDVQAIIDYDPAIVNINPFIAAAEELVTELCASVASYSPTRLVQIEIWLTAHFIAIRDPRYASESIGAASVAYQQQVGLNLGLTPFGQQVLLLDTFGNIARINFHVSQGKRAKVGMIWLGTPRIFDVDRIWRFSALPGG